MKTRRNIGIAIVIIVMIVAGAWREILFLNTNAQIKFLNGQLYKSGIIDTLSFLTEWKTEELFNFKWILTIAFTLLFFSLSSLIIWIIYKEKKKVLMLALLYLSLFVLSGFFYLAGAKIGYSEIGYTISRRCMGALQSPFPLLLLIPSFKLLGLINAE